MASREGWREVRPRHAERPERSGGRSDSHSSDTGASGVALMFPRTTQLATPEAEELFQQRVPPAGQTRAPRLAARHQPVVERSRASYPPDVPGRRNGPIRGPGCGSSQGYGRSGGQSAAVRGVQSSDRHRLRHRAFVIRPVGSIVKFPEPFLQATGLRGNLDLFCALEYQACARLGFFLTPSPVS